MVTLTKDKMFRDVLGPPGGPPNGISAMLSTWPWIASLHWEVKTFDFSCMSLFLSSTANGTAQGHAWLVYHQVLGPLFFPSHWHNVSIQVKGMWSTGEKQQCKRVRIMGAKCSKCLDEHVFVSNLGICSFADWFVSPYIVNLILENPCIVSLTLDIHLGPLIKMLVWKHHQTGLRNLCSYLN